MRQPLQIIVIPFRRLGDVIEYAVLHRADGSMWQFVSGGGEDNESPEDAAAREFSEETGICDGIALLLLDATATVPRTAFYPTEHWPKDLYVVPEYSFAVDLGDREIILSDEHDRYAWLEYEAAHRTLTWDSNRVALWELNQRLLRS